MTSSTSATMLMRSRASEFGRCRQLPTDNERVQHALSVADTEMSIAVDEVLTAGVMAIWIFGAWIMSGGRVAHVESPSVAAAARTPAWIRSLGMW